jgi:hypothetical protein
MMMSALRRSMVGIIAMCTVATLSSGCATIVSGTRQDVNINSNPQPAEVHIYEGNGGPGGPEVGGGRTPMGVSLARDKTYTVVVSAAGYQEVRVRIDKGFNLWVLGNLCCGGILGGVIDLVTGAWYKLEPDSIAVTLVAGAGVVPQAAPAGVAPGGGGPVPPPIGPAPAKNSPSAGLEGAEMYAVVLARDSEGEVRSIRDTSLASR